MREWLNKYIFRFLFFKITHWLDKNGQVIGYGIIFPRRNPRINSGFILKPFKFYSDFGNVPNRSYLIDDRR